MGNEASEMTYSAIIRTHHSFPQVEDAIAALRSQSFPPREIIVVDNSSPPAERARLLLLCDKLIDYPAEPFNYAKAINLGVEEVVSPYCLMLSSHFIIQDTGLIEASVRHMKTRGAYVFYVSNVRRKRSIKYVLVSASNFDGCNGFSNSCGFVPTAIVRERRFREDVFACEDQEWAAWYLRERHAAVLKVCSPGIRYANPRVNLTKKLNEELALATFVDRRRLSPRRIAWRFIRATVCLLAGNWKRASFERKVASELWLARRCPPQRQSRYF